MEGIIAIVIILVGGAIFYYYRFIRGDDSSRKIVQTLINRTENGEIDWTIISNAGSEQYFGVDEGKNLHIHMDVATGTFTHDFRFVHLYFREENIPIYGTRLCHVAIEPVVLLKELEELIMQQTGRRAELTDIAEERNVKETEEFLKKGSANWNQILRATPLFKVGENEKETIN